MISGSFLPSTPLCCICYRRTRAVGILPGVTVHATEDPFTASLFADVYCGVDTSLIFYMKPGSIVSRQFMSKDTHSTHGDLLVVHGNAQGSSVDRVLAKQTAEVLGFDSPSFTFNTDLFLPVGANAALRELLVSSEEQGDALKVMQGLTKTRHMSAVPQVKLPSEVFVLVGTKLTT